MRLAWPLAAVALALAGAACGANRPASAGTGPGAPDILATRGGVVWSLVPNVGLNAVLRSTDAGRHWQDVLSSRRGRGLAASYFLGPDDAWVVAFHAHPGGGQTSSVLGTTDGGRHWWLGGPLPGDEGGEYQLSFADPLHGWILGSNALTASAQLWRTADGGRTWQLLPSRQLPLHLPASAASVAPCQPAIVFASGTVGLLTTGTCQSGSATAEIWRTADGGLHWNRVLRAPGGGPGTIDIGQPRVVTRDGRAEVLVPVVAAPSRLVIEMSANGGRSWHIAANVSTPGPTAGVDWFYPVNTRQWVISAPGRLIETADAGRTWRFLSSAVSLPGAPASFTSLETGFLQGSGLVAAMATTDAGRTWTAERAPPSPGTTPANFGGPAISRVQLVSPRFAVAAGWAGLKTSADGGRTWTLSTAVPSPVGQVDFLTARAGFVVADGELLRTSDGGAHWQAIPQPGAGPVQSVDFWTANDGVAYVYPDFLVTADGGTHWQPLRLPPGWSLDGSGLANAPTGIDDPLSASVCFASDGTGWAVAGHHGRAVLVSTDAAHHWRVALPSAALPRSAPAGLTVSLAGCIGHTAWVVVDASLNQSDPYDTTFDLLRTTDLGRSWLDVLRTSNQLAPRPLVPGTPPLAGNPDGARGPIVLQFAAPASLTAWATECAGGPGGCENLGLGLTEDGGLSWRNTWYTPPGTGQPARWPFPAGANWIGTSAIDAQHAWMLFEGSAGVSYLYATSDGGATWRRIQFFQN